MTEMDEAERQENRTGLSFPKKVINLRVTDCGFVYLFIDSS